MRALMAGSVIRESHREGDARVQDPYCIRCQPQVTGAAIDLLRQAAGDAGDRGERGHRQPAGAVGRRHRLGRQLPRRTGCLRRRPDRACHRRDRRHRAAAGGADGRPDACHRPAAVPDAEARAQLRLHDRRGHDRRADEREQAPRQSLLDRLDADLRQPGGPRLDGRPRRAAAGADEGEPRAHPRGRSALRRAGHRVPRAADHQPRAAGGDRRAARRGADARRGPLSRPGSRDRRDARAIGRAAIGLGRRIPGDRADEPRRSRPGRRPGRSRPAAYRHLAAGGRARPAELDRVGAGRHRLAHPRALRRAAARRDHGAGDLPSLPDRRQSRPRWRQPLSGAEHHRPLPGDRFRRAPDLPRGRRARCRRDRGAQAAWHAPYHAALAAQIARVRDRHGVAILYDCHSIRCEIPFLFDGTLPDFNIGTNNGATCAPELEAASWASCAAPPATPGC